MLAYIRNIIIGNLFFAASLNQILFIKKRDDLMDLTNN